MTDQDFILAKIPDAAALARILRVAHETIQFGYVLSTNIEPYAGQLPPEIRQQLHDLSLSWIDVIQRLGFVSADGETMPTVKAVRLLSRQELTELRREWVVENDKQADSSVARLIVSLEAAWDRIDRLSKEKVLPC